MGFVPDETDIAEMPISKADLASLFQHLDEAALAGYQCDHSFSLTKGFLTEKNLSEETVIPWLCGHGAGCDCEIMFNVAENWADVVGYSPPDEDEDECESEQVSDRKKAWWKFW